MGSYGSIGSAAPYIQAASEGAIGASVGGSMKLIIDRNKKKGKMVEEYFIIMEKKLIIFLKDWIIIIIEKIKIIIYNLFDSSINFNY